MHVGLYALKKYGNLIRHCSGIMTGGAVFMYYFIRNNEEVLSDGIGRYGVGRYIDFICCSRLFVWF